MAVEELLTRPGLLLLVRGEDPAAVADLRRELGDLGTVTRVVRDDAAAGELLDPDDVVGREYGLRPEGLALVRPDGYLGLVADSADPGLLRGYLDDVLRVRRHSTV